MPGDTSVSGGVGGICRDPLPVVGSPDLQSIENLEYIAQNILGSNQKSTNHEFTPEQHLYFINSIENFVISNREMGKYVAIQYYQKHKNSLNSLKKSFIEISNFIDLLSQFKFETSLLSEVNSLSSSSSSSQCVSRKLHIWFESYVIPDQLIIFAGHPTNPIVSNCRAPWPPPNPCNPEGYGRVLLDTGLIGTMGFRYYCVKVPPVVSEYSFRLYAPDPGTAWVLIIRTTCDNCECSPNGNLAAPGTGALCGDFTGEVRALYSKYNIVYD